MPYKPGADKKTAEQFNSHELLRGCIRPLVVILNERIRLRLSG